MSFKGTELRDKRKKARDRKNASKLSKANQSKSKQIFDSMVTATQRLMEIDFTLSPTQPNTPGDGNCFIHGVLDQLKYDRKWKNAKLNISSLREQVTASLLNLMFTSDFNFHSDFKVNGEDETPEQWILRMSKDREYVDHYYIELCSEFLNRRIIIYPLWPEEGWTDGRMIIDPKTREQPVGTEPLYLLYFTELVFKEGAHYQSIRPRVLVRNEPNLDGSNVSINNVGASASNVSASNASASSINISTAPADMPTIEISNISIPLHESTASSFKNSKAWAKLLPVNKFFKYTEICNDDFTFGIAEDGENNSHPSIDIDEIRGSVYRCISVKQFTITKMNSEDELFAELKDFSTNGTFVNEARIGKGNSRKLKTNDFISVGYYTGDTYKHVIAFRFVLNSIAKRKANNSSSGNDTSVSDPSLIETSILVEKSKTKKPSRKEQRTNESVIWESDLSQANIVKTSRRPSKKK